MANDDIQKILDTEEAKKTFSGISGVKTGEEQQKNSSAYSKEVIDRAKLLGIDPELLLRISKETNTEPNSVNGQQVVDQKKKDEKEIQDNIKKALSIMIDAGQGHMVFPMYGNNEKDKGNSGLGF